MESILNISRPSCPNSQNRRFGSHFKPFLRQAAQIVKMDDSGAILSHFCAKLPKLPKWMISGPWVQYMYRDWHPSEVQTCRGFSVRLREQASPCREPSARPREKALPCRSPPAGADNLLNVQRASCTYSTKRQTCRSLSQASFRPNVQTFA